MPDPIEFSKEMFDTGSVLDKAFEGKTGTPPPPSAPAGGTPPPTEEGKGGEAGKTTTDTGSGTGAGNTAGSAPAKGGAGGTPVPDGAASPPPASSQSAAPLPEELAGLAGDLPATSPATPPPAEKSEVLEKIEAVPLSQHAQPKTAEAFATVKTLAREEIGRLSSQVAELKAKVQNFESRPAAGMSEAEKKELEELRTFRAGIQLRGDPAFAVKFDQPIASLEDQFLAELRKVGASEKNIADIKAQGGVDGVDVEALLKTAGEANPTSRRVLEAILRKRDDLKLERDGVVNQSEEKLRAAAEAFRKEREGAEKQVVAKVGSGFDEILPNVHALRKYEMPPGADERTRSQITAANQQIDTILREARAMAVRQDPEARSELGVLAALGVVHRLKAQGLRQALVAVREDLKKAEEAHAAEVKKLNEQLATLRGASRIGSQREVIKPSESGADDLKFGSSATDAFAAYEKGRVSN